MNTQVVHGIELSESFFPPRQGDVLEQWHGVVRGCRFLFIKRMSMGGTYSDWEAHEHNVESGSWRGGLTEYSRQLSSLVQLVIDGVEMRSMERLKPKRKVRTSFTRNHPT